MRDSDRIVLLRWLEARAQILRPLDAPEVLEACLWHAAASSREEWARYLVEADAHHYVGLVRGDNVARAYALVDAAARDLLPSVLDVLGGALSVVDAAALRAVSPIVDGKTAHHAMSLCINVKGRLGLVPKSARVDSAIVCASDVASAADQWLRVVPGTRRDPGGYSDDEDELEVCGRVAHDVTCAFSVAALVVGPDAWRIYGNALIRAAWCVEHEDCRASRELGRACVADQLRAAPKKMLANG